MKKFAKTILTIFILIFAFFSIFNYSFATNTTNDETTQSSVQTDDSIINQQTGAQITTTISSTSSADQGILSLTNIINILMIAVGIVIILLAIAILTRLKNKI